MKFIRKAAAIALVGAMIVTTVQTAAPDVVKAQVLYETNSITNPISVVAREEGSRYIEYSLDGKYTRLSGEIIRSDELYDEEISRMLLLILEL